MMRQAPSVVTTWSPMRVFWAPTQRKTVPHLLLYPCLPYFGKRVWHLCRRVLLCVGIMCAPRSIFLASYSGDFGEAERSPQNPDVRE